MGRYARVAIGSWGERTSPGPICWGLAGCLERRGTHVRHFFSRACYGSPLGTAASTGATSHYLDSWLLSTDDCRRKLIAAYPAADCVLVEGNFAGEAETCGRDGAPSGGDLAVLAHRLHMPQIVVLEASWVADCRLPARPVAVDAVILDGLESREQFFRLQTCVEGAWGVPVVAGLERDEGLRQRLVSLPRGRLVPPEVVETVIDRMEPYYQHELFQRITDRATLPQPASPPSSELRIVDKPTVAVAFDDAFCGYFADVLEHFEQLGARVVDFSPLADEALPDDVDLVFIGCGRPDEHAERLAANHCMRAALRDYARRGGYVYGEGGGAAYLSRTLTTDEGTVWPMVDALPLSAWAEDESQPFEPVEFSLRRSGPFGPAGAQVKGYRGGRFRFEPLGCCETLAESHAGDLFQCNNTIAGRVQVHLSAHPGVMRRLLDRRDPTGYYAGAV